MKNSFDSGEIHKSNWGDCKIWRKDADVFGISHN